MSEPYSTLFEALKTALQAEGGPFEAADSVQYWVDDVLEELMPDKRIVDALSGHGAHLLMCWPGGGCDPNAGGGGNSQREEVLFTLRYGCGAPDDDYEQALRADGTKYWGAFAVHDWVLNAVFQVDGVGSGYETPARLLSASSIPMMRKGQVGMTLRFAVNRLRSYSD